MHVTICRRFGPNEGDVVSCVDRMRAKYTAKWGVQIAGMNFQTRSGNGVFTPADSRKFPQTQSVLSPELRKDTADLKSFLPFHLEELRLHRQSQ